MKTILYILIFNFSAISFAQDPVLFDTDWFLMELTVDGANVTIPNNGQVDTVPLSLAVDLLNTFPCNYYTSEISNFSNVSFTMGNFGILEYNCFFPETQIFEEHYTMGFYRDGLLGDKTFDYLLDLGANDTRMLTITNLEGDIAIYGNAALSINYNAISQFALFPNPVKNELFLSSKNIASNLKLKIFNIAGKLLSTQTAALKDQTSIDVSQLVSGLYFLKIEDGNGNTEVKKFIKE